MMRFLPYLSVSVRFWPTIALSAPIYLVLILSRSITRTNFNFLRSLTWVCVGVIFVAGCAGRVTNINSLSFQQGQAQSNEQILLRNIIAAAHDKTPTFVAASTVQSLGEMDGGITASFSRTNILSTFTPSLSGKRSQSVAILDYGATKAAQHLYSDLPLDVARQLLLQGWPPRLMETVLFAAIEIDQDLDLMIASKAERNCDTTVESVVRSLCDWNKAAIKRCKEPAGYGGYINDGADICAFDRFQVLLNRFRLTGTDYRVAKTVVKDKDGKPILNEQDQQIVKKEFKELFDDEIIEDLLNTLKEAYKNSGEEGRPPFAILMRSPSQVIEFLGRLAAMQLFNVPPDVARVPVLREDNLEWVVPFRVVRGRDLDGPSAVSVRVGALGSYHVPQPDPLSRLRDQSVRVMALVIELQNRARQEAPIQGTGIAILQ